MAVLILLLYLVAASTAFPCLIPKGYDEALKAKRFGTEKESGTNVIVLDSNTTLTPFSCHNWRVTPQALVTSVCSARSWGDNASRPYIMVEFWRYMERDTSVVADSDTFMHLITSAVPAALVKDDQANVSMSKIQFDANAADYGRAYHRVLLEAVSDNITNEGWDIFITNLDTRPVPKYKLRLTCVDRNLRKNKYLPCPDPVLTGPCSLRGKCLPDPIPKMVVPRSYCKCDKAWGDYGCQKPVPPLNASTSAAVPAGTWMYFQTEIGSGRVVNITNSTRAFELLVTMQQRVTKTTWDVILCMKPFVGDPDRGYDRNLPGLPDLAKFCDLSDYFMFKLRSFMVLSRDALVDTRYYIAVYHRSFAKDSEPGTMLGLVRRVPRPRASPALVLLQVQAVHLDSSMVPASNFVCPFNCGNRGSCVEVLADPTLVRAPAHPLPFKCQCGNGFGDVLCNAIEMVAVLSPDELNHIVKLDVAPNNWVSIIVKIPDPKSVVHVQDIQIGFTAPCCSAGFLRVDPPNHAPWQDPLLSSTTYPPRALDRPFLTNVTYITNGYIPFSSLPQYWKMPDFKDKIAEAGNGVLGVLTIYNDAYYDLSDTSIMSTQLSFYMNMMSNTSTAVRKQPVQIQPSSNTSPYNQYEVVVISVSCSAVFVGVALFMYNRIVWRQRLAHRQRQAVIRTREVGAFRNPRHLLEPEPDGTPKEVIDALPTIRYKRPRRHRSRGSRELVDMLTTDIEDKWDGSSIARDDSDMCLVCLDLFRHSETLRQLPCTHQFHKQCIDTWLEAHTTCPTCRDDVLEPRCLFQGEEAIPLRAVDSVGRWSTTPRPAPAGTLPEEEDEDDYDTAEEDNTSTALDTVSRASVNGSIVSELLDHSQLVSSPLSSQLVDPLVSPLTTPRDATLEAQGGAEQARKRRNGHIGQRGTTVAVQIGPSQLAAVDQQSPATPTPRGQSFHQSLFVRGQQLLTPSRLLGHGRQVSAIPVITPRTTHAGPMPTPRARRHRRPKSIVRDAATQTSAGTQTGAARSYPSGRAWASEAGDGSGSACGEVLVAAGLGSLSGSSNNGHGSSSLDHVGHGSNDRAAAAGSGNGDSSSADRRDDSIGGNIRFSHRNSGQVSGSSECLGSSSSRVERSCSGGAVTGSSTFDHSDSGARSIGSNTHDHNTAAAGHGTGGGGRFERSGSGGGGGGSSSMVIADRVPSSDASARFERAGGGTRGAAEGPGSGSHPVGGGGSGDAARHDRATSGSRSSSSGRIDRSGSGPSSGGVHHGSRGSHHHGRRAGNHHASSCSHVHNASGGTRGGSSNGRSERSGSNGRSERSGSHGTGRFAQRRSGSAGGGDISSVLDRSGSSTGGGSSSFGSPAVHVGLDSSLSTAPGLQDGTGTGPAALASGSAGGALLDEVTAALAWTPGHSHPGPSSMADMADAESASCEFVTRRMSLP